jgi:hypothetical protein
MSPPVKTSSDLQFPVAVMTRAFLQLEPPVRLSSVSKEFERLWSEISWAAKDEDGEEGGDGCEAGNVTISKTRSFPNGDTT